MKKRRNFLMLLCVLISNAIQAQYYHFKSGFNPNVHLKQYELNGKANQKYADIYGLDKRTEFDWEADLDEAPAIGNFRIYYEKGDTAAAKAIIIVDPMDESNSVLKFQLNAPNVPNKGKPKGRIQAAINGNKSLSEFSFKLRLYIHPDIDTLKYYRGTFDWFTLNEFWNNKPSEAFPFRVTLNIQKPDSTIGSNLYFGAHGQTKNTLNSDWDNVWNAIDVSYPVPTGQWLRLETYFLEGDSTNGRYKVTITDTSENTHILFDITGFTHHPQDSFPDGVSAFNPMKLYTSGGLINGMASAHAELSVLWDDFEFWIDSTLATSKSIAIKKCHLYPNPTNDLLTIQTDKSIEKIQLYDAFGVMHHFLGVDSNTISLSTLKNGLYFIKIDFLDGSTECFKIVKE